MTLDEILSYLADLEPQQEEEWINEMIRQQQRRLRKRLRAQDDRQDRWDYSAPSEYKGALGAERE